jgi:ribosomal protein S18 acetylase RimI-like enzyme
MLASAKMAGMGEDSLIIRIAQADDADAMGLLHVRAWQQAYRGVMPDAYLDALLPSERADMWRGNLSRSDSPRPFVAVLGNVVVGFAVFGAAPQEVASDEAACGELYAINLDPDYWGQGIGRVLLRHATAELASLGFTEAVLWVVPENARARSLYESEGWTADGAMSTEEILGVTVTDIRYRRPLPAATASDTDSR